MEAAVNNEVVTGYSARIIKSKEYDTGGYLCWLSYPLQGIVCRNPTHYLFIANTQMLSQPPYELHKSFGASSAGADAVDPDNYIYRPQ